MKLDNFTIKSQEALQQAFTIAQGYQQQAVENGHVLKGILEQGENISNYLLKKLNVNPVSFQQVLDKIIESYPKVSGGDPYLSKDANRAVQKAINVSKEMGDQFVSVEHLLLGILAAGDSVSQLMKDNGIAEKELKLAIQDLRKGSKVNSQTAEDTYNSLNRFAINLIEQARAGKLDPVIGRDDEIRRLLQILSRRTKNNPILIGEPGVGKTAIAEGIVKLAYIDNVDQLKAFLLKNPSYAAKMVNILAQRLANTDKILLGKISEINRIQLIKDI